MPHPAPTELIEPDWLWTGHAAQTALRDQSLVHQDGRIVAVLPAEQARVRYPQAKRVALPRHLLLPGLINAHTHAAMCLLRGVGSDLPLEAWLQGAVWPLEQRWMGAGFVRAGSELAAAEMIRSGITCFADMYFFPEVTADVARASGLRAVLGLILIDFPSAWAQDADAYLARGLELRDSIRHHPRLHTMFAPHAPYTVSDEPLRQCAALAEELELPLQIHLHETAQEVRDSELRHGRRPLERISELGLLGSRLMAVHATQLLDGEIDALAAAGASVVHCPESNMKLASGICPAPALAAAGVNLAIGTDGAASNNDLDLLGELRSAGLLAKVSTGDASALPAPQLLEMATLGGARALGIDAVTGSLEAGKAADLLALDLSGPACQPVHDPLTQAIYSAGRDSVAELWVAGQRLLRARELLTLDESAVIQRASDFAARMTE